MEPEGAQIHAIRHLEDAVAHCWQCPRLVAYQEQVARPRRPWCQPHRPHVHRR